MFEQKQLLSEMTSLIDYDLDRNSNSVDVTNVVMENLEDARLLSEEELKTTVEEINILEQKRRVLENRISGMESDLTKLSA